MQTLTAIYILHTESDGYAPIPYIVIYQPTQCDVGTHITVCLVHLQWPCVADVQECTYTYCGPHVCYHLIPIPPHIYPQESINFIS